MTMTPTDAMRALEFAAGLPPARARLVVRAVGQVVAARSPGEDGPQKSLVATCCEADMQEIGNAVAAALRVDTLNFYAGLRARLPELLRAAAKKGAMDGALAAELWRDAAEGMAALVAARRPVAGAAAGTPTAALEQWRARTVMPTPLSSAELRKLGRGILDRSVFSARTTKAEYLADVALAVDDMLAGKINQATGRWRLMQRLAEIGYDPETGFPDEEFAGIPPAERGTLRDLSSERRLDLMLETNRRMAANYGRMVAGNGDYALREYPAWELVRLYERRIERGSPKSLSPGWMQRWFDAGAETGWEGAARSEFAALKWSPIWQALGDGAGGYDDTLGNPYPPYAFNSGLGWREIGRREADGLGLLSGGAAERPRPSAGSLSPGEQEVNEVFAALPEDLRAAVQAELREEGMAA